MYHDALRRHPDNDKLRLYWAETYHGYAIQQWPEQPQIENYLASTLATLEQCLVSQRLTFAVRLDLRFPDGMPRSHMHENNEVLTRFFRHLRYELERAHLKYPHQLRYVWAREQDTSDKPHYHLLLLLNKNAVDCIGHPAPDTYGSFTRPNLFHRVTRSWFKAMGFAGDDPFLGQLVNISQHPVNGQYWSSVICQHDFMAIEDTMFMASYLCKAYSKTFGQGIKVFDCSRR